MISTSLSDGLVGVYERERERERAHKHASGMVWVYGRWYVVK